MVCSDPCEIFSPARDKMFSQQWSVLFMPIHFWIPTHKYGTFSNFSGHAFKIDGVRWPTVEHFYQASKFEDASFQECIRLCQTPRDAKNLGRSDNAQHRAGWEEIKEDVMRRALQAKFRTHVDARELLISTGDELLIEDSPDDFFWGTGDGTGQNRLGVSLMELRAELRESGPPIP